MNARTDADLITCAGPDCAMRFFHVPARLERAPFCLDCADARFGKRDESPAPVVPCSVCGVALTLAELRFLWSDRDFLDHGGRGDHYASIAAEHEPAYFVLMTGSALRDEPCPVCRDGRTVHTCAPVTS